MTTKLTVTTRDLRRLCAVADPSQLDGPCDPMPISVLHELGELIPCDVVSYQAQDPVLGNEVSFQALHLAHAGPDEGLDFFDDALDAYYWSEIWPTLEWNPARAGGDVTVHRSTDCRPRHEIAAGPPAMFQRVIGLRHLVTVPLGPRGSVDYRIMLWRVDGRTFSEREVVLLELLRPHLMSLHDAVLRRARGTCTITTRQLELLRFVAAGYTNLQIAHRLALSEGTVRRHLQNTYERLHVNNRTAAVAAVFPATLAL